METAQEIGQMIDQYLYQHLNEVERTILIKKFISKFDGADLFDRKNFEGHITASAYVLNESADSIALLKHKFLNKWLQPGGHIDLADKSVLNASLRELDEEMNIKERDVKMLSKLIFDVDSHLIPENKSKNEPQHIHHDISFLFQCTKYQDILLNEQESLEAQWVKLSDLNESLLKHSLVEKLLFCCSEV